jgi:hypothetical protein
LTEVSKIPELAEGEKMVRETGRYANHRRARRAEKS